ncbi:MAG: hypothetical protein AAGA31_02045 [Bacteroidota bacterium]
MPLRFVFWLGFLLLGANFVASQDCYVYQENKLVDSLVFDTPTGNVPRTDTSIIMRLGYQRISVLTERCREVEGTCFSRRSLEKIQKEIQIEQDLILRLEALWMAVMPAFDSIINVSIQRAIQDFKQKKKLCLIRAETLLYTDESAIDVTPEILFYLRAVGINEIVTRRYDLWLEEEIGRLGLEGIGLLAHR